eukprot:scaffold17968_cov66-Phaeocystis_antarctica.AAC.4
MMRPRVQVPRRRLPTRRDVGADPKSHRRAAKPHRRGINAHATTRGPGPALPGLYIPPSGQPHAVSGQPHSAQSCGVVRCAFRCTPD